MKTSLTKKDVAQRQLVTAIRLFFDSGDPVSVYSLSANAWEIIDELCTKSGTNSLSNQTRENIPKKQDLKRDFINSPYRNFFKHADRDTDAILLDFDETKVDSVVFLAVEDYLRLANKSPVEFQVFQLWYLAIYTEKISTYSIDEIMPVIDSTFTNIRNMIRKDQILLGRKVLDDALMDIELNRDTRTEKVSVTYE